MNQGIRSKATWYESRWREYTTSGAIGQLFLQTRRWEGREGARVGMTRRYARDVGLLRWWEICRSVPGGTD